MNYILTLLLDVHSRLAQCKRPVASSSQLPLEAIELSDTDSILDRDNRVSEALNATTRIEESANAANTKTSEPDPIPFSLHSSDLESENAWTQQQSTRHVIL